MFWGGFDRFDRGSWLTDSNGVATVVGQSDGDLSVGASKEGYYPAGWSLEPLDKDWPAPAGTNTMRQIVLTKKLNPIPLYVKEVKGVDSIVEALKQGKTLSYDLGKGDYLPPYGKGTTADFVYKLKYQRTGKHISGLDNYDAVFSVSFSNEGDGIQSYYAKPYTGSELRLSRQAPEEIYENLLTRHIIYDDSGRRGDLPRKDQNYFFRVQTRKDAEGNITSAMYGKIYGEIHWGQGFTYFLNPTPNSRNVEWDGKHNLFDPETLEDLKSPGETLNATNAPVKPRQPILEPPPPPTKPK